MISRRMSELVLSAVVAIQSVPAFASGRDCTGYESLKDKPAIQAARVVGSDPRVFFVKSEIEDKACPANTKICRRRAFLVPGNVVILSDRAEGFVCATFANSKGIETNGWLPEAAVTVEAPDATLPWPGTWVREEAEITIKASGRASVAIKGDATYGARDPDRVKRGAVNVGEISGVVAPQGNRVAFAMGNDNTLPVEKGDDTTCKVWLQRIGDFLLVDDNNNCGGMNVSFRGTYARR